MLRMKNALNSSESIAYGLWNSRSQTTRDEAREWPKKYFNLALRSTKRWWVFHNPQSEPGIPPDSRFATYKYKTAVLFLFLFCLANAPICQSQATAAWQSENIDVFSRFPSLAFDPSGKPAIAYFRDYNESTGDRSNMGLKYAHYDGASWIITSVGVGSGAGYSSSLAFDLSGNPAIAYKGDSGNLEFAHFNGISWDVTTFSEYIPSGNYKFISLAFDSTGNPGIAYTTYKSGTDYVRYVYFNGSSWNTSTIDVGVGMGGPSLAFDASGNPALTYRHGEWISGAYSFQLWYARFNGSSWDITAIDSLSIGDMKTSLAFNASNHPAISYSFAGYVKYAHFNGTSWSISSIAGGRWNSLAFDRSNNPNIAYQTFGAVGCDWGCLSYAHFNGTSWEINGLDVSGGYATLAFDALGHPAVAHTRGFSGYLDYIHFVPDTPPNPSPVANAGADQTANEGTLITLDGSGSSGTEGASLTYHWIQIAGPPVTLNLTDPVHPTFVAPEVPAGGSTLSFELTVNDAHLTSDPDVVNITVKNVNHPPVADAGGNQTVQEGSPVTLSGSASFDLDDDVLTYNWAQTAGPLVALSDPTSAQPSFTAPLVGSAGAMLTFQLTVSDGIDSATDTVNVLVENVNHSPTAQAGADQTKDEGSLVTLNGLASSDPDGDPLTYYWSQLSGPSVTLADPFSPTPSFAAPPVTSGGATLIFQLAVSDGQGGNATDEVVITMLDINDPPACGRAQASPALLWPPNHKLVPIGITGVSDPNNDQVTITVTSVTQDEAINDLGDGDTSPDAVIQGDSVLLRAERAGGGNGRVYEVIFSANDASGGSCMGSVSVCVPHDRQAATCVDDGQFYNALQP